MGKTISILTVVMMAVTVFTCTPFTVSADTVQYDKNKIIVVFEDDITEAEAEDIIEGQLEELDIENDDGIIEEGTPTLVTYDDETDIYAQIQELEDDPNVAYAQPNYHYEANGMPANAVINEKLASNMWYFDYMDVPEAWKLIEDIKEAAGPKDRVKVAVIDTGVLGNVEELSVNFDAENSIKVAGDDPENQLVKWAHGTNVASIIGATSNNNYGFAGIAAGKDNDLVSVSGINVFADLKRNGQKSATTADTIKGIRYATEYGAQIINMSMGYSTGYRDAYGNLHDDQALEDEINRAVYECDIPVICSAGNSNSRMVWVPADFDATIGVIGISHYTNAWGNAKYKTSNYGEKKTIGGAGQGIYKCFTSGKIESGSATSWAAPTVTAVGALMLYVNPSLTSEEVREILCSTATDLYKEGYDDYTGYGLVNAYSAVSEAALRAVKSGLLGISETELGKLISETKPTGVEGEVLPKPTVAKGKTRKHKIKLSWKHTGCRINKTEIYRADSPDGIYKHVKTINKKTSKYTSKGLARKHSYYYKIRIYGTTSDGKKVWSDFSDPIEITTR